MYKLLVKLIIIWLAILTYLLWPTLQTNIETLRTPQPQFDGVPLEYIDEELEYAD